MKYRESLPTPGGGLFMTDGGLETTLVFKQGFELPWFAAFTLLDDDAGREALLAYFGSYAEIARRHGIGLFIDTPTWRASPDWGQRLGYPWPELERLNLAALELLLEIRSKYESEETPVVVSGCVGPRGDGYSADAVLGLDEAEAYHAAQIGVFADGPADMVAALTMTHTNEAIGITRAARTAGLPVMISFTVETDGRLPSGQRLGEAVRRVDDETAGGPAFYMINCAHPTHFDHVLDRGAPWVDRIRAFRVNASASSHAELDAATELDEGDPAELGRQCGVLRGALPRLLVAGGCCGTDTRHAEAIARQCQSTREP